MGYIPTAFGDMSQLGEPLEGTPVPVRTRRTSDRIRRISDRVRRTSNRTQRASDEAQLPLSSIWGREVPANEEGCRRRRLGAWSRTSWVRVACWRHPRGYVWLVKGPPPTGYLTLLLLGFSRRPWVQSVRSDRFNSKIGSHNCPLIRQVLP
jgi:hypothetical protein